MNEIKTENDASVADQDNEYDGWLELYNSSQERLQLQGLQIFYNTSGEPEPIYTFPDTMLSPRKYLIVWIDGDIAQSGLHTNTEITLNGSLILGYDSINFVDSLNFGFQSADLSFGSYPNGSRVRSFLIPTFAAQNYQMVSDSGHMKLYPNPANDKLYILLTPSNGYESIEIINCQMQQIMRLSRSEATIGKSYVSELALIDVSLLSEGIYFATIRSYGRSETVKFIIAR
ncbi:hypothetical protein SDC9_46281 [bioreactor metagenome]|uniref:LTD domain-containing protein n=1 Tax=bioreactor metagenome TaxID=1076179 RepID=A0A644W967_9ZZZZ